MERVEKLQDNAQTSASRANEISTEYTKNTNTVIDRLIFISLGTASLLFTFMGVLFSSSRDVKGLEFKYIFLAMIGYLVAAVLYLLAKWLPGFFRYAQAHSYYLQDLIEIENEKLKLLKSKSLVNSKTGRVFTTQEGKDFAVKLENNINTYQAQVDTNKHKERVSHFLYRYAFMGGIFMMLLSYISVMYFLVGMINIINN